MKAAVFKDRNDYLKNEAREAAQAVKEIRRESEERIARMRKIKLEGEEREFQKGGEIGIGGVVLDYEKYERGACLSAAYGGNELRFDIRPAGELEGKWMFGAEMNGESFGLPVRDEIAGTNWGFERLAELAADEYGRMGAGGFETLKQALYEGCGRAEKEWNEGRRGRDLIPVDADEMEDMRFRDKYAGSFTVERKWNEGIYGDREKKGLEDQAENAVIYKSFLETDEGRKWLLERIDAAERKGGFYNNKAYIFDNDFSACEARYFCRQIDWNEYKNKMLNGSEYKNIGKYEAKMNIGGCEASLLFERGDGLQGDVFRLRVDKRGNLKNEITFKGYAGAVRGAGDFNDIKKKFEARIKSGKDPGWAEFRSAFASELRRMEKERNAQWESGFAKAHEKRAVKTAKGKSR